MRLGAEIPAAEFRRLGKPGAYRLGLLRKQGVPQGRPPSLFRARFTRRRDQKWRLGMWLAGLLASVALIAVSTAAGLVFVPLLAGLGAGMANRAGRWPPMIALPAVAASAAAGWVLPFAAGSGHGDPGGRLAHAVGALTGLPDGSAGVAALTMLIAVIQGLAGYWLGGAITPRPHPDRNR